MRKALREADIGVQEMADYLGVARNTVSTWINGRIPPSKQTLRLWAMRTGVSYEWLSDMDPSGRGGTSLQVRRGSLLKYKFPRIRSGPLTALRAA
jgi:transcriptional regulator with XRE-family HTH domain